MRTTIFSALVAIALTVFNLVMLGYGPTVPGYYLTDDFTEVIEVSLPCEPLLDTNPYVHVSNWPNVDYDELEPEDALLRLDIEMEEWEVSCAAARHSRLAQIVAVDGIALAWLLVLSIAPRRSYGDYE